MLVKEQLQVPNGVEFGKYPLILLQTLINFKNCTKPSIPETYQELFALVRLADFVGCESYFCAAAKWLETTVDNIRNINGTH